MKWIAIAVVAATALISGVAVAYAQDITARPFIDEVKLGVLAHDVPDLWSGFSYESGVDINAEVLFSPALSFLGGVVQPAAGVSVNSDGDTSKAYLDARIIWGGETGFFLSTGLGAAVHDGVLDGPGDPGRKWLGHRILFHVPLEAGWRFDEHNSLSVYFDHMSNGNTASVNEGLDDLGVRYGYRY